MKKTWEIIEGTKKKVSIKDIEHIKKIVGAEEILYYDIKAIKEKFNINDSLEISKDNNTREELMLIPSELVDYIEFLERIPKIKNVVLDEYYLVFKKFAK